MKQENSEIGKKVLTDGRDQGILLMICKHNEAKIANVVYGQPQSEKF